MRAVRRFSDHPPKLSEQQPENAMALALGYGETLALGVVMEVWRQAGLPDAAQPRSSGEPALAQPFPQSVKLISQRLGQMAAKFRVIHRHVRNLGLPAGDIHGQQTFYVFVGEI
jgi:hypothetical protein